MSWKVLIADDEPTIRRGLKTLIEGSGEDLEVVAEAEDGELALELALLHKPEILVIDVRMPIRGGLDLIAELNGLLPGRIIIIVSGHDEFEYAQSAVKLRVFEYVLKPVDAEAFAAVLRRVRAELESRREASKFAVWANEQLDRNLPQLRARFLRDWAAGALSRTELDEGLAFLKMAIPAGATLFGARFAERGVPGGFAGERDRRLALVALRAVLEEAFSPGQAWVFDDDTETVLALAPDLPREALADIVDGIERRATDQVYQVPSLATRSIPDPRLGLADAYEEITAELADGGNCEAFVVLARNFIDKHYWNPELCLEDAARELQISPGYLSRLMKRETGYSFVEYLNRIRVKKATVLMGDPAAKAFEVAERVGYRSQHYFSRAFKKVMGTTPTDHRKGP